MRRQANSSYEILCERIFDSNTNWSNAGLNVSEAEIDYKSHFCTFEALEAAKERDIRKLNRFKRLFDCNGEIGMHMSSRVFPPYSRSEMDMYDAELGDNQGYDEFDEYPSPDEYEDGLEYEDQFPDSDDDDRYGPAMFDPFHEEYDWSDDDQPSMDDDDFGPGLDPDQDAGGENGQGYSSANENDEHDYNPSMDEDDDQGYPSPPEYEHDETPSPPEGYDEYDYSSQQEEYDPDRELQSALEEASDPPYMYGGSEGPSEYDHYSEGPSLPDPMDDLPEGPLYHSEDDEHEGPRYHSEDDEHANDHEYDSPVIDDQGGYDDDQGYDDQGYDDDDQGGYDDDDGGYDDDDGGYSDDMYY